MNDGGKRIVGFGMQDTPNPPAKDRETKPDYVKLALDRYLCGYKPYDLHDGYNPIETRTSREIQEDIKDMVTASISTITEYMTKHGYEMIRVDRGSLAWALQSDLPL